MTRDEAIQAIADQLGVDVGTLTTAIEGVGADVKLNAAAIADAQTDIDALVAAGMTRDEAIAEIASELNIGIDALTTAIEGISTQVSDIESNILAKMKEYQDQNMSADDALAKAIEDVAGELGKTKEDILTQLGTTEANLGAKFDAGFDALSGQIEDTRTAILEEVAKNEAAGMERDDALSAAIDTVAGNLDTTRQELLDQLGVTEENLANDIAGVSSDLEVVANYVGKPASEVTDADIDFVADIIAQQEVLADPTSFVPTDQQLQYDVNNDGLIDINDQNMLEQALAGQDVSLSGQFEATGLYAYNDAIAAQQKLEAEQRFEQDQQLQADRQLEMQTQINRNEQLNKFDQGARDLIANQAAQPSVVTTNPGELADIGQAYDFKSIFRDQDQEQFYIDPFDDLGASLFGGAAPVTRAKGGIIEDDTDRLIRLIGEG